MSTESARRILFKDFGGKKAMKALERKEKMKVNVDVVKDQLDKTLLGNRQKVEMRFIHFCIDDISDDFCFFHRYQSKRY